MSENNFKHHQDRNSIKIESLFFFMKETESLESLEHAMRSRAPIEGIHSIIHMVQACRIISIVPNQVEKSISMPNLRTECFRTLKF